MRISGRSYWSLRQRVQGLVLLLLFAGAPQLGSASPPLDPLPVPCYSFDFASPQISPTGPIQADDLLRVVHPGPSQRPFPEVKIDGAELGMGLPDDELDAISTPNSNVSESLTFMLVISVDRDTVGQVPPDPQLRSLGIPYNVQDQAQRGHAAGDLFMTTSLFTKNGMAPGVQRMLGGNTFLGFNNWDEGGTDPAAEPETSANGSSLDPQDDLDAVVTTNGFGTNGVRGLDPLPILYYSAGRNSPSLGKQGHLPGNSGADIFGKVIKQGTAVFQYADAGELGLNPLDDIDALVVFEDAGSPAQFGPGDEVLLSLTADSPSVQTPDGSAADIMKVTRTAAGPQITFFARAFDLGLMGTDSLDNVDALEFFFCSDALDCARRHGIRRVGDYNRDEKVDLRDASFFWSCFTGPSPVPPPAGCEGPFDTNLDGDVDLADWGLFAHDMTGPL